jgi:hypothetical protein
MNLHVIDPVLYICNAMSMIHDARSEFFTAMTPCSDVIAYQRFGGPCYLHLQHYAASQPRIYRLKSINRVLEIIEALLTVARHADCETFLEATILTSVSVEPDDEALSVPQTAVLDLLLDAPSKEALKQNTTL